MKTVEELRKEIPLFEDLKWRPETIEKYIQQIQQDALQSSDNYKKGYLDACDDLEKLSESNGNAGELFFVEIKDHKESKRKEFGL